MMTAFDLKREFDWLEAVLDQRFKTYFGYKHEAGVAEAEATETGAHMEPQPELKPEYGVPPDLTACSTPYAALVKEYALGSDERLAMALALAPYFQPQILDCFFAKNQLYDRRFTEFGGMTPVQHGGFIPTGETLAFVLAGAAVEESAKIYRMFYPKHCFSKYHLLCLGTVAPGEPPFSGSLQPGGHVLERLGAEVYQPAGSRSFPAQLLSTDRQWTDLVISDHLADELEMIAQWQIHKNTLYKDWKMVEKLRPGYRVLFYGPPGTGKTMTAALLGKHLGRDVYRIDLSAITSKYIGETEKNLAQVFDYAAHRDWVLFFDEADALFGKRSQVKDAHDRYVNQEVAYLLQRLETFDGLVILATNLKDNIDTAFMRRFEQSLYFALPAAQERKKLWQQTKPEQLPWAVDVDIDQIAKHHEMTGGMIVNALAYACLRALAEHEEQLTKALVTRAIAREFYKVGKTI